MTISRPAAALLELLIAVAPLLVHAQPDPLASPECQAARAELAQALEQAPGRGAPGERLATARARVGNACLGGSDGGRERSGAPDPPQRVPPPVISTGRAPLPPKLDSAPPPLAIPRPTIITTCDPSGCWDSEGRRLNNAPPVLIGPRGLCSSTGNGSIVNCP